MLGKMSVFISALIIMATFEPHLCEGHGRYLSSVYGEVGRGNITHFSMAYHGTVLLELTSLTGDCDLYVSQFTIRPNYEPHSYCLQSMTCGVDTIIVPRSFKRPIGIGIFGYPIHTNCKYHLLFYEIDDVLDVFNHDQHFSENVGPTVSDKPVEYDSENNIIGVKEEGKVKEKEKGEGEGASISVSGSGSESVGTGAVVGTGAETGGGEVKEIQEKRRTKKIEEPEESKLNRRRKYYEGESYFWLFLDYLIDCLIDLIL